jgi:transposase
MSEYSYWVGLDDDAEKICVAILRSEDDRAMAEFVVERNDRGLRRLLSQLKKLKGTVRCVYEAGPCGYGLQRWLTSQGVICQVAAPSLTPKKPGKKVKTNRIDARELARLYRGKNLTFVHVPDHEQEGLRDLMRAREDAQQDVLRCRNRLSKFLLRHGHHYTDGVRWTQKHLRWIDSIRLQQTTSASVLMQYKAALAAAIEQLQRYERLVAEEAKNPAHAPTVEALSALRGISTTTALTIKAETGDLRRYPSAPAFMDSTGLVPSEFSTGDDRRQGSITKTGNAHLRRVLIEAAWSYTRRYALRGQVSRRREKLPTALAQVGHRADLRLTGKYRRMVGRHKRPTVAVVAIARELAGFVWAIGQNA